MSTSTEPVSQFDLPEASDNQGLGAAASDYWTRVKGGDMGSLPAIIGVVVLVIIFGALEGDTFLTEQNFANLINQGAAITVLAMGLVFVLLLGEIDLSAGFTAGMGAAITAVTVTEHGWPWPLSLLAALLTGVVIGGLIALMVAYLGIPSFVVTLAFFLGLQGIMLLIIGEGGTIPIRDEAILSVMNENMPVLLGWLFALLDHRRLRRHLLFWRSRSARRPGCRPNRRRSFWPRSAGWRRSCSSSPSCSTRSASAKPR